MPATAVRGKTVLITGCSTGIGRDTAQRLSRAGHLVVATARDINSLTGLQATLNLPLDVTDAASIKSAVREAVRQMGRIDVLVNNAGYAVRGAVEEVSDEQLRRMFDVNVFGVVRMVREVAPYMRRQGGGRIITIGSYAGRVSVPVNGTYSATKFALEALSDASRLELAPFGIQVVLIEPGNIRSHFYATAQANAREILSDPASPYKALYQRYNRVMASMRRREASPQTVSRAVQRAIEARRPRARYLVAVPLPNRAILYASDSVRDFVFARLFAFQ